MPGSSPALIQQIRTVDLVGAGYSAGSWGAKREQSSDHHTEQTGYWGEDDKEVILLLFLQTVAHTGVDDMTEEV